MGEAAVGFSWLASERWTIEAMGRIPMLDGRVEGAQGVAHVGLAAAGAGLSFAFTPREAMIRPSAGVGVAFAWTRVDGVANAPFIGQRADLFAAVPYASLSSRLRMTSRLWLAVQVLGGVSLPPQAITFAGRQVATFGEPLVGGTLMLEVGWR
jgi:hypothetical protein